MAGLELDSTTTRDLLDRAEAGDARALDRLLERHRKALHAAVRLHLGNRLKARVDPSDIIQETEMAAFRRLPDYLERRPMPFRLWLLKTAHERVLDVRRRHLHAARRSVKRELPLPDRSSHLLARRLVASSASPSHELDRKEQIQRVRHAVARLSEADQEILLMRTLEGLSNQEVALILDIDAGTASKRHGRALFRLGKLLAGKEGGPP